MKLNHRGYVLVEIILASVIAFGIAYYMLDLTIKLKNKNDDLLAKTLVKTDRAIIQNKLYKYISEDSEPFSCDNISINSNSNVIKYKGELVDIVNKYTQIDNSRLDLCQIDEDVIKILIPLNIEALNKSFDVTLDYVMK